MHADAGRAKFAVFLGGLLFFYLAESLWSKRAWETSRWKRLGVYAATAALNSALSRVLITAPLLPWVEAVRARHWGLAGIFGFSGGAWIAATVICFDGYDYWWHRFNHRVPFLWRFHRVHHMDTHVDVTTSLRFHFGELFLSGIAKALWILAWGPEVWVFALCEASVTLAAQFHHSNLDFPEAWEAALRPLVMTPRVHTAHHAVTLRTRDANYATVFSIWDRLFASFAEPDPAQSSFLGLPEGRADYLTARALLLAPFQSETQGPTVE